MPESLRLPLLAFVLGWAFTWLSMPLARALGILDQPGAIKIHRVATPRFGGLGILAGALIPLWWGGLLRGPEPWGLLVMGFTGALDDRFDLPPKAKLLGQTLSGSLLAWGLFQQSGSLLLAAAGFALVLGLSNAVNLMDGMDGLAGGSSLITCAGLALLSAKLGRAWSLEACEAAALLGFLCWNYPKARTFMGDVGSLAIGYLLALSISRLGLLGPGPWFLGLLLAALPCYDAALGILRRTLKGRPWFEGDRDHFYDQLHRRFGDPVRTLWAVYAATLALWVLVLPLPLLSLSLALIKGGVVLLLLAMATLALGFHRGSPAVRIEGPAAPAQIPGPVWAYVDRLAALMEKRGVAFRIVNGALYRRYHQIILPAGPLAQVYDLDPDAARDLLRHLGGVLVRWTSGIVQEDTGWYALTCDKAPELEALAKKVRWQVRKGLENFEVRRIGAEEMAERGYPCYLKAFERYKNLNVAIASEKGFKRNMLAARDFEDLIHYWGVFAKEELAGISAVQLYDRAEANFSMTKYHPDYLRSHSSSADQFVMLRYYLGEAGFGCTNHGYRSLLHDTATHEVLTARFGHRKTFTPCHVRFAPVASLFVKATQPLAPLLERLDERLHPLYVMNRLKRD